MEENPALRWTGEHLSKPLRLQVTIDMVPDVALIEIFDFYMTEALGYDPFRHNREVWIILAHVCRKWRDIVFGSPSRLNVRVFFNPRRSMRVMLDTWPPFPIDIWGDGGELRLLGVNNIVAALEHNNRIKTIDLSCSSKFIMEPALAAMQKPFPSLKELSVSVPHESVTLVVPDLILNGSAPLLRSLRLKNFQFPLPALRNLLLSATDLVELRISRIPKSRFISPEAVIACLSGLTRLEEFELGFQSPIPWGNRQPPPSTRFVLPALTSLQFNGQREYLEHLIASIDGPLLDYLDVTLFHSPVLDTPQLAQFADRTPKLKARLKALHEVHFILEGSRIYVSLPWTAFKGLRFEITRRSDLSDMVQLCTLSFLRTLIPTMKCLYIADTDAPSLDWPNDVENSQWLDLLRPFTTVKDLYLTQKFSPHVAATLDGMTEVLPSLQNLFLEKGPLDKVIRQSVAALHLSGHPLTVSQFTTLYSR